MSGSQRDWTPVFRWVLLLGGLGSSWISMASGEMPFSMWLGISAIILAGAFGASLPVVGGFLSLFFLRYALFVLPVFRTLEQPWTLAIPATLAFTVWESAPLWVAGVIGVWALRRRDVPGWYAALLAGSAHLTLAAWLPRPYYFSWGAPFLSQIPGAVWMFGADLLAAFALAWVCLMARAISVGNRDLPRTLLTAFGPLAVLLLSAAVCENWQGTMIKTEKETHDVVAVQGALPPFSGGFPVTSERLLAPIVMYSSLHPDLVIFPECIVQVGGEGDKNDEVGRGKRHYAAVGLSIASPYSQVLFGVRDWNTNRIYFTDMINGKPDVTWKDQEYRTPFVDMWPKAFNNAILRWGFKSEEQIGKPERTPNLGILIRDESQARGLRKIGSALVLMSGEIRRPLLVNKIRGQNDMTVAINSTIAGWMGSMESQGSVLQAQARAMELGMTLYHVGQRSGTGLFVPWLPDSSEEISQRFGPGSLRFKARLPLFRRGTGFTSVFWVFLYLAPVLLVGGVVIGALHRLHRFGSSILRMDVSLGDTL